MKIHYERQTSNTRLYDGLQLAHLRIARVVPGDQDRCYGSFPVAQADNQYRLGYPEADDTRVPVLQGGQDRKPWPAAEVIRSE